MQRAEAEARAQRLTTIARIDEGGNTSWEVVHHKQPFTFDDEDVARRALKNYRKATVAKLMRMR